jgi:hypothetical protein
MPPPPGPDHREHRARLQLAGDHLGEFVTWGDVRDVHEQSRSEPPLEIRLEPAGVPAAVGPAVADEDPVALH